MIIREFSKRDIDEITSLMKNLCTLKGQEFDEARWRLSMINRMEMESNTEVFVAIDEDSSQVHGMGYCSIRNADNGNRFGYISNLIVEEAQRRSGIGEQLMTHIIDYFKRNHIESIRLTLKANLEGGPKNLFKKIGFTEIFRIFELKI